MSFFNDSLNQRTPTHNYKHKIQAWKKFFVDAPYG